MSNIKQPYQQRGPVPEQVKGLESSLKDAFGDERYIDVLKPFVPLGLADRNQILESISLSRRQLDRVFDVFGELGGDSIVNASPVEIRRPDMGRGRPPTLLLLGPMGAALLRANGFLDARTCNLSDGQAIGHAHALLDLFLCAQAHDVAAQVETEIRYDLESGNIHSVRPDLMVTLEDGKRFILEIEQDADISLIRRLVKGLQNRQAFFQSPESEGISRTVGILFNLPRDASFDNTMRPWTQALQIVTEEQGGDLSFRPLVATLPEFLKNPDWAGKWEAGYWEILIDPAQLPGFGPSEGKLVKYEDPKPSGKRKKLPKAILRYTPAEDLLIMRALYQHFLENGPELFEHAGDPAFFEVMKVIYIASHPLDASPRQLAMVPHLSLYLLKRYLQIHSQLRDSISKAMVTGGSSMRWNLTLIQFRMEVVIHRFLYYHGWRSSLSLEVKPAVHWDEVSRSGTLAVSVRIDPALLMREGDTVVPSREEVHMAESALAWVLRALFAYANHLGLKRPKFW